MQGESQKQADCVNVLFKAESMTILYRSADQQKGARLLFVTGPFFVLRGTVRLGDRRIMLSTLLTLVGMIDGEA